MVFDFTRLILQLLVAAAVTLMFGARPVEALTASANGSHVKVALVLSISAEGEPGKSARSIRQGFEMALAEWQEPAIELLVEDDGGNPDNAERAVRHVLDEGAKLIIGPQLPDAIRKAAEIADAAGVPVICFTNEPAIVAPGLFRLGVDPDHMMETIIDFSRSRGFSAFGAFLPDAEAGRMVEDSLRKAVTNRGGSLVIVEHYPAGGEPSQEVARKLAETSIDAVFLYDNLGNVARVARVVKSMGVDLEKIQTIGTGNWASYANLAEPALDGGWYASPDLSLLGNFSRRYKERFGDASAANSYLAYDAASLAVALYREHGAEGYNAKIVSQPSGFAGLMGLFRFRRDGSTERGLGVFRVNSAIGLQVLSPLPIKFDHE
jgi:ABC-type branched-subunit amino acid transport system substrate-binding protein